MLVNGYFLSKFVNKNNTPYGWYLYSCAFLQQTMHVLRLFLKYKNAIQRAVPQTGIAGANQSQSVSSQRNNRNNLFWWRHSLAIKCTGVGDNLRAYLQTLHRISLRRNHDGSKPRRPYASVRKSHRLATL